MGEGEGRVEAAGVDVSAIFCKRGGERGVIVVVVLVVGDVVGDLIDVVVIVVVIILVVVIPPSPTPLRVPFSSITLPFLALTSLAGCPSRTQLPPARIRNPKLTKTNHRYLQMNSLSHLEISELRPYAKAVVDNLRIITAAKEEARIREEEEADDDEDEDLDVGGIGGGRVGGGQRGGSRRGGGRGEED